MQLFFFNLKWTTFFQVDNIFMTFWKWMKPGMFLSKLHLSRLPRIASSPCSAASAVTSAGLSRPSVGCCPRQLNRPDLFFSAFLCSDPTKCQNIGFYQGGYAMWFGLTLEVGGCSWFLLRSSVCWKLRALKALLPPKLGHVQCPSLKSTSLRRWSALLGTWGKKSVVTVSKPFSFSWFTKRSNFFFQFLLCILAVFFSLTFFGWDLKPVGRPLSCQVWKALPRTLPGMPCSSGQEERQRALRRRLKALLPAEAAQAVKQAQTQLREGENERTMTCLWLFDFVLVCFFVEAHERHRFLERIDF